MEADQPEADSKNSQNGLTSQDDRAIKADQPEKDRLSQSKPAEVANMTNAAEMVNLTTLVKETEMANDINIEQKGLAERAKQADEANLAEMADSAEEDEIQIEDIESMNQMLGNKTKRPLLPSISEVIDEPAKSKCQIISALQREVIPVQLREKKGNYAVKINLKNEEMSEQELLPPKKNVKPNFRAEFAIALRDIAVKNTFMRQNLRKRNIDYLKNDRLVGDELFHEQFDDEKYINKTISEDNGEYMILEHRETSEQSSFRFITEKEGRLDLVESAVIKGSRTYLELKNDPHHYRRCIYNKTCSVANKLILVRLVSVEGALYPLIEEHCFLCNKGERETAGVFEWTIPGVKYDLATEPPVTLSLNYFPSRHLGRVSLGRAAMKMHDYNLCIPQDSHDKGTTMTCVLRQTRGGDLKAEILSIPQDYMPQLYYIEADPLRYELVKISDEKHSDGMFYSETKEERFFYRNMTNTEEMSKERKAKYCKTGCTYHFTPASNEEILNEEVDSFSDTEVVIPPPEKDNTLHLQRGLPYTIKKYNDNERGPAYSLVRMANRSEYRPYGKDENSVTILRNNNGQIIKMTEKIQENKKNVHLDKSQWSKVPLAERTKNCSDIMMIGIEGKNTTNFLQIHNYPSVSPDSPLEDRIRSLRSISNVNGELLIRMEEFQTENGRKSENYHGFLEQENLIKIGVEFNQNGTITEIRRIKNSLEEILLFTADPSQAKWRLCPCYATCAEANHETKISFATLGNDDIRVGITNRPKNCCHRKGTLQFIRIDAKGPDSTLVYSLDNIFPGPMHVNNPMNRVVKINQNNEIKRQTNFPAEVDTHLNQMGNVVQFRALGTTLFDNRVETNLTIKEYKKYNVLKNILNMGKYMDQDKEDPELDYIGTFGLPLNMLVTPRRMNNQQQQKQSIPIVGQFDDTLETIFPPAVATLTDRILAIGEEELVSEVPNTIDTVLAAVRNLEVRIGGMETEISKVKSEIPKTRVRRSGTPPPAETTATTTTTTTTTTATSGQAESGQAEPKVVASGSSTNQPAEVEVESLDLEGAQVFKVKAPQTIQIPKYLGSNLLPAESWGKVVRRAFRAGNVSKEMAKAKMLLAVVEPYFSTLEQIIAEDERENKNMSIDDIIDTFITSISTSNLNTALVQFQNRKQRINERAFEYGLELKKLGGQCFVNVNRKTADSLILHRFIEGLQMPLRRELKISMPKDLEEAMNTSLILESGSGKPDITTNTNAISQQQPPLVMKRDLKYNNFRGKLPIVRNIRPRLDNNEKKTEISAIDLSETRCFNCGTLGHIQKFCHKPRQARGPEQKANNKPNHLNWEARPSNSGPKKQ